jgi:hypothetical protein
MKIPAIASTKANWSEIEPIVAIDLYRIPASRFIYEFASIEQLQADSEDQYP